MKLTKEQAEHLYELSLQNFQNGCIECDRLKLRLEKYMGEKTVRRIKRIIKKNPYEK